MILLNAKEVDTKSHFPDGTFALQIQSTDLVAYGKTAKIIWKYEQESEAMALYYIVHHLRNHSVNSITLFMPYCPNARMDRTHHKYEVFTLKCFADFINALGFSSVSILDPHSNVVPALIDRCRVLSPDMYIAQAIEKINDPGLLLFYPDEGAMKRYSGMFRIPYGFGIKRRCWESGKITGLDVVCDEKIEGKNVLIVDDICCRGGTFLHSAKALKEKGAKSVSVFCSHCEHTIFDGELLKTDFVDHVYTTDSIFFKSHDKITVFPV